MNLSEENDLHRLIQNTKSADINGFIRSLKSSNKKTVAVKVNLVEKMSKIKMFDKDAFLAKKKLTDKRLTSLKFEVFTELIDYLKSNATPFTSVYLQSKTTEFDILLRSGLFIKANKRFKRIIMIADGKCDYDTCLIVQRKAIEHRLYRYRTPIGSLKEESEKLTMYQSLSDNLTAYALLSDEILNAHYNYLDRRAYNSKEILKYLEHPLLKSIHSAKSILAKYHFYRAKSLIYIGDNNFELIKKYSLKAYDFLLKNPSKFRDDTRRLITCLNNYLDASMHLMDESSYNNYFPKVIELANYISKGADIYSNVLVFETLTSIQFNYYWIIKDVSIFTKNQKHFEQEYLKYESILRPNFKVEILLGFARMNFLKGDFKEANKRCLMILNEKYNPTTLFISCSNLLRIMINYDSGNLDLIEYLVTTSKYSLKKRGRLFDLERAFLNGLSKINYYTPENERSIIFKNLYDTISKLLNVSDDIIIDRKIRLLEWISSKVITPPKLQD